MAKCIFIALFLFHLTLLTFHGGNGGLATADPFDPEPSWNQNGYDAIDDEGVYARPARKPFQPMRFGKRLSVVNKDRVSQLFKNFPKD